MLGRFCVCVVLLSVVRFTVCQTLYSAMRGGESPELQALKTTLKQLTEELRVIKEILPKKDSCPPSWSSFGSSCYLVNPNPKSYKDAALSCIMQGSKLVEIETQQENSFLKGILKAGDYWTGGTDSLSENKWVWPMTGKSLADFSDWGDGEPNDSRTTEDCLEFHSIRVPRNDWYWNDNTCNKTLSFICEKNLVY